MISINERDFYPFVSRISRIRLKCIREVMFIKYILLSFGMSNNQLSFLIGYSEVHGYILESGWKNQQIYLYINIIFYFKFFTTPIYKLSCSITCAPLHSSAGFKTTGTSMEAGPVQMK